MTREFPRTPCPEGFPENNSGSWTNGRPGGNQDQPAARRRNRAFVLETRIITLSGPSASGVLDVLAGEHRL